MTEQSTPRRSQLDLSLLNSQQLAAVTHRAGPLLVIAGPGSGKTRVITNRIAWLIEQGTPPWRILAVTFTNRAAKEMLSRLSSLVGHEASSEIWSGTFHRICSRMLRRHGNEIGVAANFQIFDRDDQLQVVRNAIKDLQIDPKQYSPQMLLGSISAAKSKGSNLSGFAASTASYYDEIVSRVWERYAAITTSSTALDFDDLLLRTRELLEVESVRSHYTARFEHVLVDEFQDTSTVQYDLANSWASGHKNLTVVGDPDQSIYSWRSADIRNLRYFMRDYPDATEIQLNTNYRSTQQILDVANTIINRSSDRIQRSLTTKNSDGPLPKLYEAYSESDEADYVAQFVDRGDRDGSLRPGDVAVMYRTNAQSRVFEESLIRHGIPYRLVGATRFYDRREIRDLLAYLRLIRNPADSIAFGRVVNVPTRGVGAKSVASLNEWAAYHAQTPFQAAALAAGLNSDAVDGFMQPPPIRRAGASSLRQFVTLIEHCQRQAASGPLSDVLRTILDQTQFQRWIQKQSESDAEAESRWQNVQELITVTDSYSEIAAGAALDAFLEDVALVADIDDLPEGQPDAVTLITLHQAKGLEFPIVFMVGMEEQLIPHAMSANDPVQLEEERRVCYVGMTRAMRELHLVHAFRRAYQGRVAANPPSRYVRELIDHEFTLIDHQAAQRAPVGPDVRPARNRQVQWSDFDDQVAEPPILQLSGLNRGDLVSHDVLGIGEVIAIRAEADDVEVQVRFREHGVKQLLASISNLTRA